MDYKKIYDNLINTRKTRKIDENTYYETHHIIPKSMGGDNSVDNLIKLTAREHFIAHWLLYRIYRDNRNAYSFYLLSYGIGNNRKRFSSIAYSEAKEAKSKAISELNRKIKKGHTKSEITKNKLSKSLKNKPKSKEHTYKISIALKGKTKSAIHKKKISESCKKIDWSKFSERNLKISKANAGDKNGRAKKVYQLKDNQIINEFSTLKEANLKINEILQKTVPKTTFYRCASYGNMLGGYIWTYNI